MKTKIKGAKSPDQVKRELEPDPVVRDLRAQVTRLEGTIKKIREEEGRSENIMFDMLQAIPKARAARLKYTPKRGGAAVSSPVEAVLFLSDWHYGAVQPSEEIEGINEFSPDIAKRRIRMLVRKFVDWVSVHRSGYRVDALRVVVAGDLISGDIHEELKITAAFPSPVQAAKVSYLLADTIAALSEHFKTVEVDFITADNHSRFTRKPQSREEGLNSYGYIIAHLTNERLRHLKNVKFNIHALLQKVIHVGRIAYLVTHGHGIRGWAGVPFYGIERKVGREAVKRLHVEEGLRPDLRFDKLLTAHFHTSFNSPTFMINGSLSGTDAYDHKEGRFSRPTQNAWLVHPKHGEFDWTPFRLD